jgi:hypothetical protein
MTNNTGHTMNDTGQATNDMGRTLMGYDERRGKNGEQTMTNDTTLG